MLRECSYTKIRNNSQHPEGSLRLYFAPFALELGVDWSETIRVVSFSSGSVLLVSPDTQDHLRRFSGLPCDGAICRCHNQKVLKTSLGRGSAEAALAFQASLF